MNYDEYNRLKVLALARPTRQSLGVDELDEDLIEAIRIADYSHLNASPAKSGG